MPELRNPPLPLVGALLVGGASRRFGSPKALAQLAGRSFAERVAEALCDLTGELVLLGAGAVPPALERTPRLADVADARGPMAGLLAALRARPDRAWLVAACDQPWLTPAACRWLVAGRSASVIAVVPRLDAAGIEPFPGLYEPASLPVLERLAREAGSSFQPLAGRSDVRSMSPPAELRAAFADVDTERGLDRSGGRVPSR
jgi:molybdopterin-guanine dinucleotide biosynthesis protein A